MPVNWLESMLRLSVTLIMVQLQLMTVQQLVLYPSRGRSMYSTRMQRSRRTRHSVASGVVSSINQGNAQVYMDDIICWGSTLQEHNDRLTKLLQRVQKNGLKLNKAKCQFVIQEITFLGDKLSAQGIEPDKDKINAILEMPWPTDKIGVLWVMAMINFIGKFIPNLSADCLPARPPT